MTFSVEDKAQRQNLQLNRVKMRDAVVRAIELKRVSQEQEATFAKSEQAGAGKRRHEVIIRAEEQAVYTWTQGSDTKLVSSLWLGEF